MKIGIVGAGISGLSIAQKLKDKFEIEVIEKNTIHGGIARTKDINGIAYHTVGGHCFNSKYSDVLDFVFNNILSLDQWNKVKRKSMIKFRHYEINYPIEFSIKEIFKHDKKLALQFTVDFFKTENDRGYTNLDEWFRYKFGNALAEEYFIPYNTKIWNKDLKKMSSSWVKDKLPIPNKELFFNSLIGDSQDCMPHFEFYYPKSNNQNTFIDALAKGLNIEYNYEVKSIKYDTSSNKWIVNNNKTFDLIINTSPLNNFILSLENISDKIASAARKLKSNGISNVLWKTKPTDKTWTYIPDKNYRFHRYIHIGSFFGPRQDYAISEVIGQHSYDEMIESGKNDDFLQMPLAYNISDMAYVVFDDNYETSTNIIKDYLEENELYTLGRFGEWQYYNMDVCIKKAIDLSELIIKKYCN